jgi:hypothetical protein
MHKPLRKVHKPLRTIRKGSFGTEAMKNSLRTKQRSVSTTHDAQNLAGVFAANVACLLAGIEVRNLTQGGVGSWSATSPVRFFHGTLIGPSASTH